MFSERGSEQLSALTGAVLKQMMLKSMIVVDEVDALQENLQAQAELLTAQAACAIPSDSSTD